MFELAKLAGYLISPLTAVLGLFVLAGACALSRRHRWSVGLAFAGFALLWIASLPVVAEALIAPLESQYAASTVEGTPPADAIVVLGGGLSGAHPPKRPTFNLGPAAGRVWHAAALYRAGKAKLIFVAGGNQPGYEHHQVEADAVLEMLLVLGVPRAAIRLERDSRNTRENAANVKLLVDAAGAKRVLLITSALHMPRAMATFQQLWAGSKIEIIPSVTDVAISEPGKPIDVWIPNAGALAAVTRAIKEYAGMVAVAMI